MIAMAMIVGMLASPPAKAADNAIIMAYNFVTVSQNVVFNDTMRAGGTLTLTAQAKDGGGRSPGDPLTVKMVFYNSSNVALSTVQQAYTMVLGGAYQTVSASTSNCGGSCANVAYVSVQFYGKDGGYWAGNYGPNIMSPSLSFNGSANILYNSAFGIYNGNTYAQGWTSSAGWQNCALYSGAQTCVVNNGALVNDGNYSATGGTTSGAAGGYTVVPSLCCGGSAASFNVSANNATKINTFTARTTADSKVNIEQIGNSNTTIIDQSGTRNNYVNYYVNGSSNNTTITQTGNASTQVNYVDLSVTGNNNTSIISQTSTGGGKGAFASVQDSSNIVKITQKDSGSHYAEVNVSGGSKTVDITQQGSASHMASVTLSGQPTSLTLNQSGSTQQFYSITHNCATAGGCSAITVTQGN